MVEIITHVAFYIGWPNAWAVFPMVREVYQDEKITKEPMFGLGKPNDAYAKYFVGQSYLNPVNKEGIFIANVTFEPGLYFQGKFGVRIEDLVIFDKSGVINLTKSPKNIIII